MVLSLLAVLSVAQNTSSTPCVQSCGKNGVSYPFGFSDGCGIKLNCSSNDEIPKIGDFLVQSVTSDQILITIPAKCDRPITELSMLFSKNFAPTSRNGLLFKNCKSPLNDCVIPNRLARSRLVACNSGARNDDRYNISCYSEGLDDKKEFLNYERVMNEGNCSVLFSSVMVDLNENTSSMSGSSSIWLEFQMIELSWWVDGVCQCDPNAICTKVQYGGRHRFRCKCKEGYAGDGFTKGKGCRKGLLIFFFTLVDLICNLYIMAFNIFKRYSFLHGIVVPFANWLHMGDFGL